MRTGRTAEVVLRALHKRYGSMVAVRSLDLHIGAGEFVSFLGPSGCGKTTTLRAIAGLLRPDSGDIVIGGRRVNDIPAHQRGLGLVAQSYALFPHMSVLENVAFGLRMRGYPVERREKMAREALEIVQLQPLAGRYPRELSGGQQQRVALARCIVIEPDVMLLDEPLGALDRKLRQAMQVELKALQRRIGVTTIFVTHDQEEALTMSDRVAVMNEGELQQIGTPREVYEAPANRFVADFVGVCNFLPATVQEHAGDDLVLRFEDRTVTAAAPVGGLPAGAAAVVAIRPERLRLDAVAGAGASVAATVEEVVYVGTAIHYHLVTAGGTRLVAYEQNQGGAALPARGAQVQATWGTGSARALPATA